MLGPELATFEDPGRRLTIRDVRSADVAERFVPATETSPGFGYTSSAYWVRFLIRSDTEVETHPVIQLETSRFAEVDWYLVSSDGRVATPSASQAAGSSIRSLSARLPAVVLDLKPREEVWIHLRAWTPSSTFFPIFVHSDPASYARSVVIGESLWLPCLGIVVTVAILSIYFGFLFQERLFLTNALLIVLYCSFLSIHSGYWEWLEWFGSPAIKWNPMLSISQLNTWVTLFFTVDYFRIDFPIRNRWWVWMGCAASIFSLLWLPHLMVAQLTHWFSLIGYLMCLVIAVRSGSLRPGHRVASVGKHLIGFAWLADTAFMTLLIFQWNGWMPMIVSPPTGLLYPAAVSPLLVLAAISDRFYQLIQTELRLKDLERSLSVARFQALRYQMNPHFLYNALNSLRGLLLESPRRAEDFVVHLAQFLRSSLGFSDESLVPLYRELEILASYLDVEKVRFEERLDIRIVVPSELQRLLVPELVLQPLVENAIKFGTLSAANGQLQVRVEASVANGFLILEVSNSGRLEFSGGFARGSGVGLENLRRRLSLVFNGSGRLVLTQDGDQVVARVFLPQPDTEERD